MGDIGEARQKVVADWLFLSAAMRGCADSINRYITLVAATQSHPDTVKHLIQLPGLPAVGMEQMIPGLGMHIGGPRPSPMKRERSPGDDDDGLDEIDKKKKRHKKKERDPNAPKRPPSAYIFFQNEVRPEMKSLHPEIPYRELVGLIASRWAAMPNEDKEPYQQQANNAMNAWRVNDAAYKNTNTADSSMLPDDLEDANNIFKQPEGNGIEVGPVGAPYCSWPYPRSIAEKKVKGSEEEDDQDGSPVVGHF